MKRLRICIVLAAFTLWLTSCGSDSSNTTTGNETSSNTGQSKKPSNDTQKKTGDSQAMNSSVSDFETFFNESLVGRNSGNIEDALNAIIHPEMGIFLIYKPGAIQRPTFCKGIEDLKAIRASIVDEFTAIKSNAQQGELPFYDCDNFDKKGTYYKSGANAGILASTYHDMEEMLSMEVPAEEMQAAQDADEAISTDLVSSEAFLQLGFGQVDGKWYLFSIDIATFDCGA